jgi:hypothetical protein
MIIVNKIVLQWEVQDPTYSYQSFMEFTEEEFQLMTNENILSMQTEEYESWLEKTKSLERGQ